MGVTIAEIQKLRKLTGAGLADVKKALVEAEGDIDRAIELVRERGLAIAAKRSDRETSNGCVLVKVQDNFGAMIALKCETDFVANGKDYIQLTQDILDAAVSAKAKSLEEVQELTLANGRKVAEAVAERSGITGEKMELDGYNYLEGENISQEIKRLMKEATVDLTIESSRVNKKFKQNFLQVFNIDADLVETIGAMRKPEDRAKLALTAVSEAYVNQELEFGPEVMRRIEREVYLKVLDALWMQHLENMQHLREGIHWRSIGQRDPLVEYRTESQKLFEGLQKNLREEVLKILLSVTKQEAVATDIVDGEEYDTELTQMAETATNKGVNTIDSGVKNLDNEFKSGSSKKTDCNRERNTARKSKKKQRQNKKHSKR